MRPTKLIRQLGNKLGLAWWAKVETHAPDVIYWFGPFLTKKKSGRKSGNIYKRLK